MTTRGRSIGRRIRVHAPAKINLSLQVLGIRADGYHELRTLFQSLALHDTLTVTATRGPLEIRTNDPRCPTGRDNLVWRAAEALWLAMGRRGEPCDVTIEIDKRIPMQAGLGGGSSDAAAALRALTALWRIDVVETLIPVLARQLGADCPYFLEGGSVLGVDRGDTLFPLVDRPSEWVTIAIPDFGVSTADAYRWWDERAPAAPPTARGAFDVVNDLQAPVVARHPRIGRLIKALERLGGTNATMSGSGSAVFGLFKSESRAGAAARALRGPRVTTFVTQTIPRRRYRALTRLT